MNQPPHKLCIQPNKSNQEPTIPKNSPKREKYTDSKKMCWKSDPFSELKNCFAKFMCVSNLRCRYSLCLQCIGAACPRNMDSQLLILTEFGPKLSRHKKCLKRNALFSELKNCFAKFICVSNLRCRYGLCLQCIGAACPHNMGSQLLILTEFGPKQYQNAKRVHSAKVKGISWLFENFRVTSKLRVNCE